MRALLAARTAAAASAVLLLFAGCLSAAEGAGRILEERFDYTAARYQGPGFQVLERGGMGGHELNILIDAVPAAVLRASLPEGDGTFRLKSLEYLGGNYQGWVEFSAALSGGGVFISESGGGAALRLAAPEEPALISGGKIRREGTVLAGEEALTALNIRYERIRALAEWMRRQDAPGRAAGRVEDFEAYWKPLLLPELVPAKQRPRHYETGTAVRWAAAEQVRWNTAYTEQILPEELRPLRDSGTLKRDWEESRDWIFLVYAWDRIFHTLEASAIILQKK
jgi:hypothetical protein